MDYTVKLFTPKPEELYPFIKKLNPDIHYKTYKNNLKEMIEAGFKVVAAYDKQKIVGISGFWINTKFYCGKYLEIDSFIVSEEFRRKGIGFKIIDFCIKIAKDNNCQSIVLNAYVDNLDAHKFYDKLNFKTKGMHRVLDI